MFKRKNNNGVFYVVIALVAILAIGTVAYAYNVSQNVNVAGDYNYYEANQPVEGLSLGAFSGPDIYSDINIYGALTTGSNKVYSTTTRDTTITFTYNDLNNYTWWNILNMTDTSGLTFTMPATSTMMMLLPEIGSTRTWTLHNATSTADGSPTLTLATGAGMDLVAATANDDVIDEAEYMQVTCTQIPYISVENTNIACTVNELAAAD